MWSSVLAPKPKDWPENVEITGMFFDDSSPHSKSSHVNENIKLHSLNGSQNGDLSFSNTGKVEIDRNKEYLPTEELSNFLFPQRLQSTMTDKYPSKPIFIGFGSMVIEDPESVIRSFLDAAALANKRVIIQSGWSNITAERFTVLAKEAEKKAEKVRETEDCNNQSIIFPSKALKDLNDSKLRNDSSFDMSCEKIVSTIAPALVSVDDNQLCSDDDYVEISVYDDAFYIHDFHDEDNNSMRLPPMRRTMSDGGSMLNTMMQQAATSFGNWFNVASAKNSRDKTSENQVLCVTIINIVTDYIRFRISVINRLATRNQSQLIGTITCQLKNFLEMIE